MTMSQQEVAQKAKQLASEGKKITEISEELGIPWNEARKYTPSFLGTKKKITNRLTWLAARPDSPNRGKWVVEAYDYVDFLYDALKNLADQAERARKALNR